METIAGSTIEQRGCGVVEAIEAIEAIEAVGPSEDAAKHFGAQSKSIWWSTKGSCGHMIWEVRRPREVMCTHVIWKRWRVCQIGVIGSIPLILPAPVTLGNRRTAYVCVTVMCALSGRVWCQHGASGSAREVKRGG